MQSPEAGGNWPIRLPAADETPDLAIGDGPPAPGTPRGVPGLRHDGLTPDRLAALRLIAATPAESFDTPTERSLAAAVGELLGELDRRPAVARGPDPRRDAPVFRHIDPAP